MAAPPELALIGRLAEFKAEVLNGFVRAKGVRTVIEFGCGDSAQLELARLPDLVGIDVATISIERCSTRFAAQIRPNAYYLAEALPRDLRAFDLALSLDVIFHLVEDRVFDSYMRSLFARAKHHVVIYSSNYDALSDSPHVRHRKFTDWIAKRAISWKPAGYLPNRFPFDPNRA